MTSSHSCHQNATMFRIAIWFYCSYSLVLSTVCFCKISHFSQDDSLLQWGNLWLEVILYPLLDFKTASLGSALYVLRRNAYNSLFDSSDNIYSFCNPNLFSRCDWLETSVSALPNLENVAIIRLCHALTFHLSSQTMQTLSFMGVSSWLVIVWIQRTFD